MSRVMCSMRGALSVPVAGKKKVYITMRLLYGNTVKCSEMQFN